MKNLSKAQQSIINLEKALNRLQEALQIDKPNQLMIDGTIQRFEFVIELFWKTLRRILEEQGNITSTPKDTLKNAYRIGWLKNEEPWLQMIQDRNETSHIYDQKKAAEIYSNIKKYYPLLEETFALLKVKATKN